MLSQLDPKWAHKTIGRTHFTLGRWGCTITSLCMILDKMHPGIGLMPDEAALKWTFNNRAEIIWRASDFEQMKFLKRGYGGGVDGVFEHMNSEDYGVILEVNHSHWVAVSRLVDGQIEIHDPLLGDIYLGIPQQYAVSGYALFEKVKAQEKPVVPDWAKASVEKAIAHGITDWSNPQEPVTPQLLEYIMEDLGVRKFHNGTISKAELIVCLDRLGVL